MENTIKVRIAVVLDNEGKIGAAALTEAGKADEEWSWAHDQCDTFSGIVRQYIVTAEVPVPTPEEVAGSAAERA
jgi:hypothetical protein